MREREPYRGEKLAWGEGNLKTVFPAQFEEASRWETLPDRFAVGGVCDDQLRHH